MKSNDQRLQEILKRLDGLSYVKPARIPDIDLYMDQVTTFMDESLKKAKRNPDDKILTKTMINNYAKNNLLPPPVKKKYNKEHILLLIFIYYFKNMLSFHDIEQLFGPITKMNFAEDSELSLAEIYEEIFSLEKEQMERLKEDVQVKFACASETFTEVKEEDREYLQLFAFICELGFDVYLKKQMMENLIDQLRQEEKDSDSRKKGEKKN